jgi:signal transduction histidine kinase
MHWSVGHIFDAFSANHHDDLGKTGLGIGLWLTRRLIELHAGTIEAFTEGPGAALNSAPAFRCGSLCPVIRATVSAVGVEADQNRGRSDLK